MRILVISDIHSNLTALEAVLEDAPGFDAVWCLGDLVGYGPDPNQCVERIRSLPGLQCLAGNHDQASLGLIPQARFNHEASNAIEWTNQKLKQENKDFLRSLPSKINIDNFTLAHGSPRDPVWEYVLEPRGATQAFRFFGTDYCLIGHSHIALAFQMQPDDHRAALLSNMEGSIRSLQPRMILNPGSVGQPRDLDARASYAILNLGTQSWELHRVPYDILQVQERIQEAGLPEQHGQRLVVGW